MVLLDESHSTRGLKPSKYVKCPLEFFRNNEGALGKMLENLILSLDPRNRSP